MPRRLCLDRAADVDAYNPATRSAWNAGRSMKAVTSHRLALYQHGEDGLGTWGALGRALQDLMLQAEILVQYGCAPRRSARHNAFRNSFPARGT
jgi:hypothetical protein